MPDWHDLIDWQVGQLVTATDLNEQLRDNLEFLHSPAFARVYNTADISIPNNTVTNLTFNSQRVVTVSSMHSTSSFPSRLNAPYTGLYLLAGSIEFPSNATGVRRLSIILNGTFSDRLVSVNQPSFSGTPALSVATLFRLEAGEFVELQAHQNSGGALNVLATGLHSPEFMMCYLGEV